MGMAYICWPAEHHYLLLAVKPENLEVVTFTAIEQVLVLTAVHHMLYI